jgi:hypothetical protein
MARSYQVLHLQRVLTVDRLYGPFGSSGLMIESMQINATGLNLWIVPSSNVKGKRRR